MSEHIQAEPASGSGTEIEKELLPGAEVIHRHVLVASLINLTYLTTRLLEGLIKLIKELL